MCKLLDTLHVYMHVIALEVHKSVYYVYMYIMYYTAKPHSLIRTFLNFRRGASSVLFYCAGEDRDV